MKKIIMILTLASILGACSNSTTSDIERISSSNIESSNWWESAGNIDSEYWWISDNKDLSEYE